MRRHDWTGLEVKQAIGEPQQALSQGGRWSAADTPGRRCPVHSSLQKKMWQQYRRQEVAPPQGTHNPIFRSDMAVVHSTQSVDWWCTMAMTLYSSSSKIPPHLEMATQRIRHQNKEKERNEERHTKKKDGG